MKRIITSLILLLTIINVKAQLTYVEVVTDDRGQASELIFGRKPEPTLYYTTLQFELNLPNGMSLVTDKVRLASHLTHHELLIDDLGEGRMLVIIYSPQNEPLMGELLHLPIKMTSSQSIKGLIKHTILGTFDGISLPTTDLSFIVKELIGDVNGDGDVNLVDVTMTVSHILGQTPEGFVEAAADIDGNNVVDIQDLATIIDIVLKK